MTFRSRLLSIFTCACLCSSCGTPGRTELGQDLLERQRIAELIARFGHSAQRHDFQTMGNLFIEEATWEASAGALGFRHDGQAAIRSWLTRNPGRVEILFYLASEPAVDLVSHERARAQTTITELLRLKDTGEIKQLFGVYSDELVQRGGEWRFAHRRFTLGHSLDLEPAR
jgi:hypothetical protein